MPVREQAVWTDGKERELRVGFVHANQPIGFRIGKRIQQHPSDEAEDARGCTDAQGEGRDGNQRKAGVTAQAAGDSATARQMFPVALTAFQAAYPNGEGADVNTTRQVIKELCHG